MSERQQKRARLACQNCRRKKTRCSGERPACAFCARLQQPCHYDGLFFTAPETTLPRFDTASLRPNTPPSIRENDQTLASRVALIESQLKILSNTSTLPSSFLGFEPPQTDWGLSSTTDPEIPGVSSSDAAKQSKFAALPDQTTLQSLINTYFRYCHCQPYCFFQEASFRHRFSEGSLPRWLLLSVAANACIFSDDPFFEGHHTEASDLYCAAAWSEIHGKMFQEDYSVTLQTVQATSMLSVQDFGAGRCKQSWVKIGLSVRFSQALELGLEPDSSLELWEQEEYRCTFWSVYLLDRLVSCSPARTPTLQDTDCAIYLPVDTCDIRGEPISNKKIKLTQLIESPDKVGKVGYSGFLYLIASQLGQIQRHCLRRSTEAAPFLPWDFRGQFASIQSILMVCESYSPVSQFDFRSVLEQESSRMTGESTVGGALGFLCFSHAIYFLNQCLLHHPFLIRHTLHTSNAPIPPSFLRHSLTRCREGAESLTYLLHVLLEKQLCLASFLGQCAVVSGVIHRIFMHDQDQEIRELSQKLYDASLNFLYQAPVRWRHFPRLAQALVDFQPDPEATAAMINPSQCTSMPPHPDSEDFWHLFDYGKLSEPLKEVSYPWMAGEGSTDDMVLGGDWLPVLDSDSSTAGFGMSNANGTLDINVG